MGPLHELAKRGQSVWIDFIDRRLITSRRLERMVRDDGVVGMTSNPTIFQKAIGEQPEYEEPLRQAIAADPSRNAKALFELLAIEDICMAADTLRPTFDHTNGVDGMVSLEPDPGIASDTQATIAEARRLWHVVDRPNIFIKVPATAAGIPAIEQLLSEGMNINITLMFSMAHYEAVAQAYLKAMERVRDPKRVASVASFFVSRVDTAVDKQLEKIGTGEALALRGKAAVANSVVVYQRYKELFEGPGFARLKARGARVQRVLWASTSTKNPAYSEVLYVKDLVAANTVNTLPLNTLEVLSKYTAEIKTWTMPSLSEAKATLASLRRVGVNLDQATEQLQVEGVKLFDDSYLKMLEAVEVKRRAFMSAGVS